MKDHRNKKPKGFYYDFMYYIIPILLIVMLVFGIFHLKNLNIEDIVNYTPDNKIFASITMLFLYGLKSITIVIPLILLYASTSLLFSTSSALIINFIGIVLCLTIPYFIGRFSGKKFVNKKMKKYPKAQKLYEMNVNNEFMAIFTMKILGLLPNDISSLLVGSMNVSYEKFILASVLGKAPLMIIVTLMGSEEIRPRSPEFILILILFAIVLSITTLINRRYFSNKE